MKTITLTDEELAIVKEAVDGFQNTLDDWIYRHSHLEMNNTKAKSKLCDDILSKLRKDATDEELIADIRNGYAIDYVYDDEQIREQILDKLTLEGCVRDGIFTEEQIVNYLESQHGFYCFADRVGIIHFAEDELKMRECGFPKTLYLLKNIKTGEPMEMLAFHKKYSRDEINDFVKGVVNVHIREQDEDGLVDGLELYEFVVSNLVNAFGCVVLDWDNTNNLYY